MKDTNRGRKVLFHFFVFADVDAVGGQEADAAQEAAGALADGISSASQNSQEKLDQNFEKISEQPSSLMSGDEGAAALAALVQSGAHKISFERLQGFDGVDEFEPSGWQVEVGDDSDSDEGQDQAEPATMWPMGVGMALMNGCFGSGYQKGDPCYDEARFATECLNMLDAAAFIGVGFDGRGYYSSESRKKSILQRICAGRATFLGKDVPDTMNTFGLYGK